MKISKFIFLFLILFSFNLLNANEDKLKTEITKNLRCLVCQGQSVYDSDSEFAVSLKLVVENKIQQGLSEDQIYKFLTDKYGEWILYDPKFNKKYLFIVVFTSIDLAFRWCDNSKKTNKKLKNNLLNRTNDF
jgi:cytochrome c-type biogenesis protein CcmH